MTWKNIRLPILLALFFGLLIVLIFDLNRKIHSTTLPATVDSSSESVFTDATTTNSTTKASVKKTTAPKTTEIGKTTQNNNTNTSSSNNSSNDTSTSNNVNTPTVTPNPTSTPIQTLVPTIQPSTTPAETVNIQIWVRGFQYVNNQQYAADGNVKIKKDGQEIASGSVNGDIIYKASNMPINSNLEIYFYLPSGCGQVKQLNTGGNSFLYQIDFSFSSSTVCI